MYDKEKIANYTCPEYTDWPDFGLYMDQVIALIQAGVEAFYPENEKSNVTPTMINNYVKQKIITPSKNKKYSKEQIIRLYVIFLLKPAFNLSDICDGLNCISVKRTESDWYELFSEELVSCLKHVFCAQTLPCAKDEVLRSFLLTLTHTLYFRCLVSEKINKAEISALKEKK